MTVAVSRNCFRCPDLLVHEIEPKRVVEDESDRRTSGRYSGPFDNTSASKPITKCLLLLVSTYPQKVEYE